MAAWCNFWFLDFKLQFGVQIVHCRVELDRHILTDGLEVNVINISLVGLMDECEERAMVSSLSMNRMARIAEILEPIGRPSFWRKT